MGTGHGELRRRIAGWTYRALKWGRDHVPPGIRTLLGALFILGGVFGFLPILGFWMVPLGAAFIALDVPSMRDRIEAWMERLHDKAQLPASPTTPGAPGAANGTATRQPDQEH